MKKILSAKMLTVKRRTSFSTIPAADIAAKDARIAALSASATKEPGVHYGRVRTTTSTVPSADQEAQDVKLTIGATGVSAIPTAELETEAVLFEAQYEVLKEIVWDHSEKSITFVLLDGGCVAASFLFSTLSLLEEQLDQAIQNPALRRRPEYVYIGVLAGKTLPSTIQQRRSSTSSLTAAAVALQNQTTPVLPASRRRELLQQQRPVRNAVYREWLGMEYCRRGYLSFACSINNDLRGLKLDLHHISVLPSPDCHDRSACLFSYLFENVESCEAIGTRLELRFRRSGTKQPTYIALQSLEAQHIRDAIWYIQHGMFKDTSLRELAAELSSSSLPGGVRQPSMLSVGVHRDSAFAYFEGKDPIQQRVDLRCRIIGCSHHSENFDSAGHGSEASTSSSVNLNSMSQSSRGVSSTRGACLRLCEEHTTLLASSPRSPSKRGAFFSKSSTKSLLLTMSSSHSLIHSMHYIKMLKYHGSLLKRSSSGKKYQLSKAWNVKYVALFETPVGGFLCYYDKLAHCPGITDTPKERRVIELSSVICIRPESSATNAPSPFAFDVVTLYRTWTFAATERDEYGAWLHVLADNVAKHTAMAPDKRIKFPVRMMATAQGSQYQLTRHEATTLEISSYGVCVCSGYEGEVEIYSWYFTEIQKWSVVHQQGEMCCLLSCLSTSTSKSSSGAPVESSTASSPQYHEFLFQTSDAPAICHAIEFYVGKCMAMLEVLALDTRESSRRVTRRGSGNITSSASSHEVVRFKNEQVIKCTTTLSTKIDAKTDLKHDSSSQNTQRVISGVPLKPVGVAGKATLDGSSTGANTVYSALGTAVAAPDRIDERQGVARLTSDSPAAITIPVVSPLSAEAVSSERFSYSESIRVSEDSKKGVVTGDNCRDTMQSTEPSACRATTPLPGMTFSSSSSFVEHSSLLPNAMPNAHDADDPNRRGDSTFQPHKGDADEIQVADLDQTTYRLDVAAERKQQDKIEHAAASEHLSTYCALERDDTTSDRISTTDRLCTISLESVTECAVMIQTSCASSDNMFQEGDAAEDDDAACELSIHDLPPKFTTFGLDLTPVSFVPVIDLSNSPIPLLESPTFSRGNRFTSDTDLNESGALDTANRDEDDSDSDRFESFGYLECDFFEALNEKNKRETQVAATPDRDDKPLDSNENLPLMVAIDDSLRSGTT